MPEELKPDPDYRDVLRAALVLQYEGIYCALNHSKPGSPTRVIADFLLAEAEWTKNEYYLAVLEQVDDV